MCLRSEVDWIGLKKRSVAGVRASFVARDRKDWRRVSGIGKLNAQCLAIVRELWFWRHAKAQRLNQPPKRLLRDDLLVEIAKRRTDSPDKILAIRGLQRNDLKRDVDELAACVRRGLDAPKEARAPNDRRELPPQLNILAQFLAPALTAICRRAEVAASLVGTASDVRELIAHRMGFNNGDANSTPALRKSWRGELVGNLLDDLLTGRKSIRIANAKQKHPLAFDEVLDSSNNGQ